MLSRTLLHGDEDMIVRDQSNTYFHLTPKIGPLWGVGVRYLGQRPKYGCFFYEPSLITKIIMKLDKI